ncbi:MAG: hypothetical protein KAJ07_00070, partial [Planctomycetes bacterium]|nr:hypothetical protein [Planctomycetota bacterium]
MSITDGTILRVVASFLWTDGNVNQNVFNCVITGGGSPWDEVDVVDDLEDWLDDMYANLTTSLSDEIDGNEIIVYKYDAIDDDWDEVGSQSWTFNPSGAGGQLPRGVAALVRLWTTDPDVQGKKYIPALTENVLDEGLLPAATITALLAFAADWYLPFVGATSGASFAPGIWSVAGTVFKLAIDHVATSTIPAYQRR